jgi:branched-chain amino acid aminotransferase
MRGVVIVDGELFTPDQPCLPVIDRGFLYGDSVYEVIRTYGGTPFALREHLERLARSAAMVEIQLPRSLDELEAEVHRALGLVGEGEWYFRMIVTRGGGPIGLDPALADHPRWLLLVLPIPEIPEHVQRVGASVALVHISRYGEGAMPAGAKTGNYLTNVMALRRAREQGSFEAIMVDAEGQIAEGTTSNVFIARGGRLHTPPLAAGILDGITRRFVIALCREDRIDVVEERLLPGDVTSADEVFLTGTIKEIIPVTTIDGAKIGDGLPGPVTRRLRELWAELTTDKGR